MRQSCSWPYEGQTALITDAATPLGLAFAEALARRGTHLILVDGAPGTLPTQAARLSRLHVVQVDVLVADWREEGVAHAIYEVIRVAGLSVDLLIAPVGHAVSGRCEAQDAPPTQEQVWLQARAMMDLLQVILPPLLPRGRGAILVAAPVAGHQLPDLAILSALHAWGLSYGQTCWTACREGGVRVLALLYPDTLALTGDAAQRLHPLALRPSFTPAFLVAKALRALETERSLVLPGWRSLFLIDGCTRLIPTRLRRHLMKRALRSPSWSAPLTTVLRASQRRNSP